MIAMDAKQIRKHSNTLHLQKKNYVNIDNKYYRNTKKYK